jgi:hypothetical protein
MGLLDFLPVIGAAAQKLIDLIPDPNARAKAAEEYQREMLAIAAKAESDQRDINKAEAQHGSLFVAGARPAILWICAAALAFQYLVRPFWLWALGVWWPTLPPPPGLDSALWELMFGMLGMGGLRSWDKTKGVATK